MYNLTEISRLSSIPYCQIKECNMYQIIYIDDRDNKVFLIASGIIRDRWTAKEDFSLRLVSVNFSLSENIKPGVLIKLEKETVGKSIRIRKLY